MDIRIEPVIVTGASPATAAATKHGAPLLAGENGASSPQPEMALRADETQNLVTAVVNSLNSIMANLNKSIRFRLSGSSGEMYVQIVDRSTDRVLKTIPPEEMLRVMARIDEALGTFVDKSS